MKINSAKFHVCTPSSVREVKALYLTQTDRLTHTLNELHSVVKIYSKNLSDSILTGMMENQQIALEHKLILQHSSQIHIGLK